jgi:hypothetical protein
MCAAASGHLLLHRNPDIDTAWQMENAVNRSQFTSSEEVGEACRTPLCSNSLLVAKNFIYVVDEGDGDSATIRRYVQLKREKPRRRIISELLIIARSEWARLHVPGPVASKNTRCEAACPCGIVCFALCTLHRLCRQIGRYAYLNHTGLGSNLSHLYLSRNLGRGDSNGVVFPVLSCFGILQHLV